MKNSKEKLVKCATEVARLHKVSIQSCTQNGRLRTFNRAREIEFKRSLSIVNFERHIASMPGTGPAGQPFGRALTAQLRTTQFIMSSRLHKFT